MSPPTRPVYGFRQAREAESLSEGGRGPETGSEEV